MKEFIIQFLGVMTFLAMPNGNGTTNHRLVVPAFTASHRHAGHDIAAHVPFIAFRLQGATYDWNGESPKKTTIKGLAYGYFNLSDGYEITLSSSQPALVVDSSQKTKIPSLTALCPGFELDPVYLNKDADAANASHRKAVVFDITHGELMGLGDVNRNEVAYSELRVRSQNNLTITATPLAGGAARTITVPSGMVRIGNQVQERLDNKPPSSRDHFFLYYGMAKTRNTCATRPGPDVSRDRDPDSDCSNSNYP